MTIKIGKGYSENGEYLLYNHATEEQVKGSLQDVEEYLETAPADLDLEEIEISILTKIDDVLIKRVTPSFEASMIDNSYDEDSETFIIRDASTNRILSEWDYESDALEEIEKLLESGQYPDEESLRLTRNVVYTCSYEVETTQQFEIIIPDKREKEMTVEEINAEISRLLLLKAELESRICY